MSNKENKVEIVLEIALIIIASVFILGIINGTFAKDATDVVKVTINRDCSGTPWFVGVQKNFFKDAGITLDDVGAIAGPQYPSAFVSGQIDVFDSHPNGVINLLKADVPLIGVAQSGDEPTDNDKTKMHMHWLVREDSPIKTIEDISKQDNKVKVGTIAEGICTDLETNALLRKYKVPKDKIEYVVLPDANAIIALKQGLIDVAALHPPFFTALEKEGGVRIIATSTEALGPAAGQTLICFTKKFVKDHPDSIRKFVNGYKAAEKWSNDNRKEAGEITAKEIGLKAATVHYYSYNGTVNEAELQVWIDAMVADGIIKKGEFTPKDLYTDEFKDIW